MGLTAVAILAVSYLANRSSAGGGSGIQAVLLSGHASGPPPEVGKPAPDFKATTMEGDVVKLSELRGHPVWVTFGATWCQECRAEAPDIEAAYERYRSQGLKVISIFIQDDAATIGDYAKRAGLTFPKINDAHSEIANEYRIVGIPSHFFIDSSGTLRELRISALDPQSIDENLTEIGVEVDGPAH